MCKWELSRVLSRDFENGTVKRFAVSTGSFLDEMKWRGRSSVQNKDEAISLSDKVDNNSGVDTVWNGPRQ